MKKLVLAAIIAIFSVIVVKAQIGRPTKVVKKITAPQPWKIEKVILTLEFKDLNGNSHPTMATVTIPFQNASSLLKDGNNTLTCEADKFLMPKN